MEGLTMRCRNCHTQLMDTDPVCPSCHASRASATSAAPGEFTKPSGLVNMLPMFGGAIGGAIAGAMMTSSGEPLHSTATPATGNSSSVKRMFGLFFILGGILFLVSATVIFYNTWEIAQWMPKEVT